MQPMLEIQHRNNFDFVRIVAAFFVLISHQAALSGRVEWTVRDFQSLGGIGLLIFFTISGFLVCESWQRDPSLWRFAVRRMLRIWPGLAVAVTVTAVVLGPALTTLTLCDYFANALTAHYFGLLRFKDAWNLPGVFVGNPLSVINGSLWTLPIELRWYWILALLGLLRVIRWRTLLLIGTLVMAGHYFFIFDVQKVMLEGGKRGWKEELGLYFLAGACLQRFRPELARHRSIVIPVVALLVALLLATGQRHAAFWLLLPMTTLLIALQSWPGIRQAAVFGDLSYGLYIYAFPIQQTIIEITGNRLSLLEGIFASAGTTVVVAFASWHLVEKPALRFKPGRQSMQEYWKQVRVWGSGPAF